MSTGTRLSFLMLPCLEPNILMKVLFKRGVKVCLQLLWT
uniref:Uncharacterized protein n=1 Tax=Rhizophora mucronata TaxID=61149 RepID=A0A2P2PDD2_RHIMU